MDFALIWCIRLGLLALLATPLIVSPSTIFPFIVGKALYSRTVIEIVFGLWLMLIIRRPEYRPARSTLAAIFGAFLVGALISGIFGASFQRAFWSNYERMTGVFDLTHWFVALVILMAMIKGRRQWRMYLTAVLAVGMFIAFLGVLQANDVSWESQFSWLRGDHVPRLTISLGNATYVGAFGMMMTIIGLGMFADALWRTEPVAEVQESAPTRGRRRRARAGADRGLDEVRIALAAFYLLAVAGGIFMITGSGSRGASLGLVIGLGAAGVGYSIWGTRWRLVLTARGATVLLAVVLIGFIALRSGSLDGLRGVAPIFDRTVGDTGQERSAHSRAVGTQSALEAFTDKPLTGWGYESFSTVWNRYLDDGSFDGPYPEFDLAHNKLAEILATTGLLGFVSYAALWIWAVWLGVRLARAKGESQLIDIFVAAAIIGFLGHLMFLFDTTSTFMLLVIALAYVGVGEAAVAARASEHTPGDLLAPRGSAALRSEAEPERRRGRRRSRGIRLTGESSRQQTGSKLWDDVWFQGAVGALIFALVLTSLVFTQLKPLQASRAVLEQGTPQDLANNIDKFGQLGTISRTQLADVIASELGSIDPTQRESVFDLTAEEINKAVDDEPENMKVRLAAARLYRAGGLTIPEREAELLPIARMHSDEAVKIGPHVFESLRDNVVQAFAEEDLPTIEASVASWKATQFRGGYLDDYDNQLETYRELLAP